MYRWELADKEDIHASVTLFENSTGEYHLMGELIGQKEDAMVFNVKNVDSEDHDVIRFRVPFARDKLEVLYSAEDSATSVAAPIKNIVFYDEDGEVIE